MSECRYYEMCARRAGSRDLPRSCDRRSCWMFRPMPDVDALLALADEIEDNDVTYCVSTQYVLDDYARRIREALGVES